MSSVTRRFRFIDGEVREVVDEPTEAGGDVLLLGRSLLPMSHNAVEGYSISQSVHPDECKMMNDFCHRHNITGVHFDPTKKHNCRITDNRHFAEFVKKQGRENVDGGFHGY
jgi:hypothetical protein